MYKMKQSIPQKFITIFIMEKSQLFLLTATVLILATPVTHGANQHELFNLNNHKRYKRAVDTLNLTEVDSATYHAIENLFLQNWNFSLVGVGADAVGLSFDKVEVVDIKKNNQFSMEAYNAMLSVIKAKSNTKITNEVATSINLSPVLSSQLSPEANEYFLFHGTKCTSVPSIISHGFNLTYCKYTMLGQGLYFAEKAMKSDQYSDDKNNRVKPGVTLTMILARVIMGSAFNCESKICLTVFPPNKTLPSGEDSLVYQTQDSLFREFVVYKDSQAYPAYVINYKRLKDDGQRNSATSVTSSVLCVIIVSLVRYSIIRT